MTSNPSQVVVLSEGQQFSVLNELSAHHREFPEVHGEGKSPAAAAARLAELLSLTLDNAPSEWRRQSLEQAIADVLAFAAQGRH